MPPDIHIKRLVTFDNDILLSEGQEEKDNAECTNPRKTTEYPFVLNKRLNLLINHLCPLGNEDNIELQLPVLHKETVPITTALRIPLTIAKNNLGLIDNKQMRTLLNISEPLQDRDDSRSSQVASIDIMEIRRLKTLRYRDVGNNLAPLVRTYLLNGRKRLTGARSTRIKVNH
jgi:hypothetical protein